MITLNFDTFAAWFIASEVNSAAEHPSLLRDAIEIHLDNPGGTPDLEAFLELADDIVLDARDDLVVNHEALIMLSDRANEFDDEPGEDGTPLEDDMHGWLADDRLVEMLGKALHRQYEFAEMIEALAARRRETQSMSDFG